jgi:hypothetical protein
MAVGEITMDYLSTNAFFVCATLTIALVMLFDALTYTFIEVLGISFYRKLIIKRRLA